MDVIMEFIIFPLRKLADQLPMLIVLVSAFILASKKVASGKLRNTIIIGLIILLADRLLVVVFQILPLLFRRFDYYYELEFVLSCLWLLLSLLRTLGVGILVWVLIKALLKNPSPLDGPDKG